MAKYNLTDDDIKQCLHQNKRKNAKYYGRLTI